MTYVFIPAIGIEPMIYRDTIDKWCNICVNFWQSITATEGPWPIDDDGKPLEGIRYCLDGPNVRVTTKAWIERQKQTHDAPFHPQ